MKRSMLYRAFLAFRLTLGLVVLYASLPTAVAAFGAGSWHVGGLAAAEAIGAALFLWPRTLRVGGMLMLLTFGIAIVAHAVRGEIAGSLLVYGTGAFFVMLHGAAESSPSPQSPTAV